MFCEQYVPVLGIPHSLTKVSHSEVPGIFIAKHSHQAFLMSIEQIRVSHRETSHEVHHERTPRESAPCFEVSGSEMSGIMGLVPL